jgi:hypothetical protein
MFTGLMIPDLYHIPNGEIHLLGTIHGEMEAAIPVLADYQRFM